MVRGVVRTPLDNNVFPGADVIVEIFVDPPECSGTPFAVRNTESGADGQFSVLVFGHRSALQEEACLNVRAAPPSTPPSAYLPRTVPDLRTTLRADHPIDTVHVEVVLNRSP
jgi:hypothetical protein